MIPKIFKDYLKEIYKIIEKGDAREESFYAALEKLIIAFGKLSNKSIDVTVLPKKTEAGNPDFRVWDGQNKITGYIEAKHPSKKFLEEAESSEQLKRYVRAYPNVLLTNFFEFRLYRSGLIWNKPVKISDYFLSQRLPQSPTIQHEEKLIKLLTFFLNFTQSRIIHPKILAEILAYKSGVMRDYVVMPTLQENKNNYFSWLYQSFKKYLISDLKPEAFADLFSQTFTYGLFIAKYQYEAQQTLFGKKISSLPFTTKTAYDFIQKSFGILREVFKVVSTQDMPKNLEIIVDDIVDVLNNTDIYKLLIKTNNNGKRDPIFHLYETFLLKYDKERKKRRGVFYTPLEIISYIVNSVHIILKNNKLFNAPDGLASYKTNSLENSVTLLDPAAGTGTFFVEVIEKAIGEVKRKYSSSADYISKFTREHLLPHFFAFEILIAPYVVSHLKVLFSLTEEGFEFKNGDCLNIFLTNTLEFHRKETSGFPGFFEQTLVKEQQNALEVKNKTPILIVIGNPPYSVSSQNKVDAETPFGRFYESYKEKVRQEERNIQPLSDDYIKFLAFAHWKIRQSGRGIVGMITNNSYLDGLIHRDMRQKLLEDFDLIYILNLHGDAKRPKITTDGKKDENVFDIRQGVTISIFVKSKKPTKKQIFYRELIGSREDKYYFLDKNNTETTEWKKLNPKKPYYFFVPKDFRFEKKYDSFICLTQIFNKTSSGIKTHRDKFIVTQTKQGLINNLRIFLDKSSPDDYINSCFDLKNNSSWNTSEQRQILQKIGINEEFFKEYNYRIFDKKWIYYHRAVVTRLRPQFMENLLNDNLSIVTTRILSSTTFQHVFISDTIGDICYISNRGKETNYYFPLWFYERSKKENKDIGKKSISYMMLFDKGGKKYQAPRSNINEKFLNRLKDIYKKPIFPEEVFYYIYAVLYSTIYRQKYQEFLKIDFPKIPVTSNFQVFKQLSKLGKNLIEVHLLKSEVLNSSSSRFEGNNGESVKEINYDERQKKVYINKKQYFSNLDTEVWNYFIGGYQILHKWLRDRKGGFLSSEEINHYIKIIAALKETIKIQKKIDSLYEKLEKSIVTIE